MKIFLFFLAKILFLMHLHLFTPVKDGDLEKLKPNNVVYITGSIVTARDKAHKRMLSEKPPCELNVIYHAGPLVKRENNSWRVISCGPTTSQRMQPYIKEIEKKYNTKIFIGKGSLKTKSSRFLLFTGGAGVLAASKIKRVKAVYWLELGIPEALWVLEVENFGPLIVR